MTITDTVTGFLAQHGLALIEGSGSTVLVFVIIKHIPTWPPLPGFSPAVFEKIYNWGRDSLQDFASQRGGQQNPQPPAAPPAQPGAGKE